MSSVTAAAHACAAAGGRVVSCRMGGARAVAWQVVVVVVPQGGLLPHGQQTAWGAPLSCSGARASPLP